MRKFWILLIAFILVGSNQLSSQEVSAVLDHDEIKIGEQTHIDLELRLSAGQSDIMLPALKDTISRFIDIIEISNVDTTFDEDDITTKIFHQKITVTSWDSGLHVIPPFAFVVGGDTLKTEPMLLKVNTIVIEAEQDIKDIKEIIDVPFSLWDWILVNKVAIGIVILIIILAIVGWFIYKRYQNRPVEEKEVIVPKEAADTVALRKLEELEGKKLWQKGEIKEYHSLLSFIVREYIENRFEVRALEQTTDEIIPLIGDIPEVDKTLKSKLHQLLLLADMAKFAKQQPIASENEQAMKNAYQFIDQTAIKEDENTSANSEKTDNNA